MKNYLDNNLPQILYIADFPPSNLNGGSILLSRLLLGYPDNKIIVLVGSHYAKISPVEGRLSCPHIILPMTNNTGPWGIGRLKTLLNYILIPFLLLVSSYFLFKTKSRIIISVAHGHLFFVATALSILTNMPLVLFVHDYWPQVQARASVLLKRIYTLIFSFTIKQATHIYAVSQYMQDLLYLKHGKKSELQMPGREPFDLNVFYQFNESCPSIIYAGNLEGTMRDNIKILIQMFNNDMLKNNYGIESYELCIYTNLKEGDEIEELISLNHHIKIKEWLPQQELIRELKKTGILFLPFSFKEGERSIVTTSLPTKIADYLASGRPILVFAPGYSSLARYAKTYRFAEVVEEPSSEALAKGIYNIVSSKSYREELQKNAWRVFELNHNLIRQKESFGKNLSYLSGNTQIR